MTQTTKNIQDNGDLDDPVIARKFVEQFAPIHLGKKATYVNTSENRIIHFKTMSDDDAIWVAKRLHSWLTEKI